jgi:hypothetical protein
MGTTEVELLAILIFPPFYGLAFAFVSQQGTTGNLFAAARPFCQKACVIGKNSSRAVYHIG